MWRRLLATSNNLPLACVRLGLGIVMFPHGAQKMLGWFGGHGFSASLASFEHQGFPAVIAFLPIAAEFFGSLGLILGFLTRVAAFGVLCDMLVALFKVHIHNGFFMNWMGNKHGEGFEYHILAIAMALAVMVGGAGAASLDRLLHR